MFKIDRIELQRIGVAALGALILSTVSVTAAVGPARAVEADSRIHSAAAEASVSPLA